jgi:hypothetical protein
MEINAKALSTYLPAPSVVDHGALLAGTWTSGQGTSGSVAARLRPVAPTTQAIALLPIRDVVVVDGFAGSRSWSPPV